MKEHFDLLGLKVTDRVTGFKGIVDTISFDLYGCIQVGINPGLDKDGLQMDCRWYDVSRIKVLDKKPVMEVPCFIPKAMEEAIPKGLKGPADKALVHRY